MASHKLIELVKTEFAIGGAIVEIGSARETSGPDSSTFFFSQLAKELWAIFYSVDFSRQSHELATQVVGDFAILSDGVAFLQSYPSLCERKISILYLDNFDVVYNDKHRESLMRRVGTVYEENNELLDNERSAIVHLEQMQAALPMLAEKNIVIVDDTKLTENGWWGKGAKVVPFLGSIGYSILAQSEDGVLMANEAYVK